MIVPPPLQKGDTIGVMATSCWLEEEELLTTKDFVEKLGYNVYLHPQATSRLHQSAGSAAEKLQAFHDLIKTPEIKMIMSARGGNRASTFLGNIDWELVKQNPKILIGYSDLTSMLNAANVRANLVTYHGPVFRELPTRGKDLEHMFDIVSGKSSSFSLGDTAKIIKGKPENIVGTLRGGNLSLLQTLIGTPNEPDMDGSILFIEDIGDHLSRYDRMLAHLKLAGWFKKIAGLIVGDFTNVQESEGRPFGFSLEDVLLEHCENYDFPVITGAAFGHGDHLPTYPVGLKTTFDNNLKIVEEPNPSHYQM